MRISDWSSDVCSSDLASLLLFAVLVFLPLGFVAGKWLALAATMGVMIGYLLYVTVHHASHHWKAGRGSWTWVRKHAHARHHQSGRHGWYGVTTSFRDRVFASTRE